MVISMLAFRSTVIDTVTHFCHHPIPVLSFEAGCWLFCCFGLQLFDKFFCFGWLFFYIWSSFFAINNASLVGLPSAIVVICGNSEQYQVGLQTNTATVDLHTATGHAGRKKKIHSLNSGSELMFWCRDAHQSQSLLLIKCEPVILHKILIVWTREASKT